LISGIRSIRSHMNCGRMRWPHEACRAAWAQSAAVHDSQVESTAAIVGKALAIVLASP
jgi:hypothetical protein